MKEKKLGFLAAALGVFLIANTLTFCPLPLFAAAKSDLFSGIVLILLGLLSASSHREWSRWGIGVVGLWLQISPLLFWAPSLHIYLTDTFVGALAIIFSFLCIKEQKVAAKSLIPKGWSYNPSAWAHRIPTITLAMLCWFFSRYMASFQLGYIDTIWDPFFPEGTLHVITSQISKSFPVSDAGLGALCYTLEFLLGWQGGKNRWATMPWLVLAFGFLVIPVGIVSITLIILQPVVVGAWCSWCLATAACMLLMILLTAGELVATLQFLGEVRKRKGGVWKTLWQGGKPTSSQTPPEHFALGISCPKNLLLSVLLGLWLMVSPAVFSMPKDLATSNYILGPLILSFSFISLAEVFRGIRFVNILFGAGLLFPLFRNLPPLPFFLSNLFTALLVIVLVFGKGKIRERYGVWERKIV